MLIGEYNHTVDVKGRVFLPSSLRDEMGDDLVVVRASGNCLSVYSKEEFRKITDKLRAVPMGDQKHQAFLRKFLAKAADASPDKQGRIVLPQRLREQVGIEKEVTIIGVINRAEIWATDAWKELDDSIDEESYDATFAELAEYGL